MNVMMSRALVGAFLLGIVSGAWAQEAPPAPGSAKSQAEGGHRGPPPAAYAVCEGKSAGSRAEFTDPRGELLKGSCEDEGQGRMVLRPDRPPGGQGGGRGGDRRGPPPEAYAACQGKAAGAKAQFTSPRGEAVAGTCQSEGEKMVLRPDRPPAGPQPAVPGHQ